MSTDAFRSLAESMRDPRATHTYHVVVSAVDTATATCTVDDGASGTLTAVPYIGGAPTVGAPALYFVTADRGVVMGGTGGGSTPPPAPRRGIVDLYQLVETGRFIDNVWATIGDTIGRNPSGWTTVDSEIPGKALVVPAGAEGLYLALARINFSTDTQAGYHYLAMFHNGVQRTRDVAASDKFSMNDHDVVSLAVGDRFEMRALTQEANAAPPTVRPGYPDSSLTLVPLDALF